MAKRKDCYTDEQKDEIIAHVLVNVACGRSVTEILGEDEGLCSEPTFWRWHLVDAELRGKLADARANGVEARMEEAVKVARTPMIGEIRIDKMIGKGDKMRPFTEVRHEDMLGHRRLLVDTLYKSAQMLKPKTYGPTLDLTSDGQRLSIAEELEAARLREREILDKRK